MILALFEFFFLLLLDLEIDILPFKMTLNYKNNIRNAYFSQKT